MEQQKRELIQRFAALAMQQRLPHAILLEGGDAAALQNISIEIAASALCTDAQQRPCRRCPACRKVFSGNHPDVITVAESDTKRKTISVEKIRWLREDAIVKPNEGQRKVYIIPKADTMTREAQNAFLKLLEEPPAYGIFILLCERATQLLPTIRSRTQIFSLIQTAALQDKAAACAAEIAAAIPSQYAADLLLAAAPLVSKKDREFARAALTGLELILRDGITRRSGGTVLLSGAEAAVAQLHRAVSRRKLLQMLEAVQESQFKNERNCNLALVITTLCSRLFRLMNQ